MTPPPSFDSAVLYSNADNTIFIIDTPQSIALAQRLSMHSVVQDHSVTRRSHRRTLRSTAPLERPYVSTEPKSLAARAKVLEKIPLSEQRYHGEFIQPAIVSALRAISAERDGSECRWCLPRILCDDQAQEVRQQHSPTVCSDDRINILNLKRRRNGSCYDGADSTDVECHDSTRPIPPVILSSTSQNVFHSLDELGGCMVKNSSAEPSVLVLETLSNTPESLTYIIPPLSSFTICTLPLSPPKGPEPSQQVTSLSRPISTIPSDQKFNMLLFDPPWPNRSVRRSGHYQIHHYSEMDILTQRLRDILRVHSYRADINSSNTTDCGVSSQSTLSLAGIWITNAEKARRAAYEALTDTGFRVTEEWIWIKTTVGGEPVSAIDGLWRKPYEILVIGRADQVTSSFDSGPAQDRGSVKATTTNSHDLLGIDPSTIHRRVIAAVPDLHSRKPNLKEILDRVFFPGADGAYRGQEYTALEVFARNLTAGWWSCGNEVLKFNQREFWAEECDSETNSPINAE
ncbi:hypothetical protein N7539_004393 [Penicillium diatomitis]|uniref:MT-A70-domain-containing protein n=1 Tax=Penicillium diatomitis TaxID=2819901 RepID=A0A9W9XEP9_9EURO|nr:uncharacterized protein N7539_004393 [Penicillium diatomitis]KAJ5489503.1 hypothetical protein N7539_004393 [Penicillium diatomitis]